MRLVFTKGPGKFDLMDVVRDGLPNERIDCPKQRIIPHDMVHYAVEHTLKARGFLGRVKDGEHAAFQMKAESLSDSVERLVEVFQGDEWSGGTTPAPELIELYEITCAARECPALPVSESDIAAVRSEIRDLTLAWLQVPEGGTLELAL